MRSMRWLVIILVLLSFSAAETLARSCCQTETRRVAESVAASAASLSLDFSGATRSTLAAVSLPDGQQDHCPCCPSSDAEQPCCCRATTSVAHDVPRLAVALRVHPFSFAAALSERPVSRDLEPDLRPPLVS